MSAVDTDDVESLGSLGDNDNSSSAPTAKRKRSTKACDSCHKKKIKCDGGTPCQHCTNSKAECMYTPSTKKRGPRVGYIESLEKRLSMMESLLSSHVQGGSVSAAAAALLMGDGGMPGSPMIKTEPTDDGSDANSEAMQMQAALKRARGGPAARGGAASGPVAPRGGGRARGRPPKPATPVPGPTPPPSTIETTQLNDMPQRGRAKPSRLKTSNARDVAPPGTISPGVANPYMFSQHSAPAPTSNQNGRRRSQQVTYAEHSDSELESEEEHQAHYDEPAPAYPAHLPLQPRPTYAAPVPASEAGSINSDPTTREPVFAENEVIMPLITLFFSHVYPLMPVIHRSSFLERLVPTNQHPPLLLNAIYSMSARFSNDPLFYTDPRRPYAAGEPFFNRAKKLLQNALDEPAVATVQSLLLMALGAAGSGKGSLGWLYTGMAIRMAQEMKMNIDYEDLPMVDKPLGWIDRETRRRIWWSCFTMDRCISAGADRPFTIDERDCLLSLPADETIWEHTHSSFNDDDGSGLFSNSRLPRIPFTNTLPYTSPPPGSPPLSHIALNVVLCDILGKVLRYANNARRVSNRTASNNAAGNAGGMGTGMGLGYPVAPQASPVIDSELAILDASLRNWYRSLPPELTHPHLSGFPYNQHVWIGGYLHIMYHAVLVILHRPSFPFPYGPLPIPQSEIGAATHNDPPNGPIASIYTHADEPGHPTILEPQLPANNPVWPTPISRDVCTTSAERVGKILEEVIVPNPFLNRFSGFAAYCMFHTGVVHIINAVYPYENTSGNGPTAVTGDVAARARRLIKAHVLGLRRMTRFWSLAGRYLEALENLMRANGLDKEFEEAIASEKQFGGIELAQAFQTADDDEEFGILAGAVGMRPPSPDLPAPPAHRPSLSFQTKPDLSHHMYDPSSPPSGLHRAGNSMMDMGFPMDAGAGIGSLHPFYSSSGHFPSLKTPPGQPLSPDLIGSPHMHLESRFPGSY